MAPRTYWKGYLKLSLVSCAVGLYPAASIREKASFHRINRETGHRLKQLLIDSETGEPVSKEGTARGYEIGKREYIEVNNDELDNIQIESTHTIDIDTFVPRDEVDDRYLSSPYYIAPTEKVGQEAFAVIRDAIQAKRMVGLARIVLTWREHAVMLEPFGKGILGVILRYPYEIRDANVYLGGIPDIRLPEEMKQLAGYIVETKSGHFAPGKFVDHYETALLSLLKHKRTGGTIKAPKAEPAPRRVVNLMDALRASIAANTQKKAAATDKSRNRARKAAS
jgi:DNA end-binding protein Ku